MVGKFLQDIVKDFEDIIERTIYLFVGCYRGKVSIDPIFFTNMELAMKWIYDAKFVIESRSSKIHF